MDDRRADVVGGALGDPQQARNAPVLGLADALAGVLEAQQIGQFVLGVGAVETLAAPLQLATLLVQKALGEAAMAVAKVEFQFDAGRSTGVAPGPQFIHAAGAVALEEGRADRRDDGAFAGFVGPDEQVEAGLQRVDFEGLAELLELLDAEAGELHRATLRRSSSRPASRASASRATSPSGPSWPARSSASTSPR